MGSKKRMFSMQIVDTDAFLDMPLSTQALYFHLVMRADDEGFVSNPKRIMKLINAQEDDLKILTGKRFILTFQIGIVVIKHWLIHNNIRADRIQKTLYQEERKMLKIKDNKAYSDKCLTNVRQMSDKCPRSIDKVRLDEVRLDQISLGENSSSASRSQKRPKKKVVKKTIGSDNGEDAQVVEKSEKKSDDLSGLLDVFYRFNPSFNFGHRGYRESAKKLLKTYGEESAVEMARVAISIQGMPYAPIVVNPSQLLAKLGDIKAFIMKEKSMRSKENVVIDSCDD